MQANVESQFFSQRNESSLVATLAQQLQGQGGLSEKQRTRLNKAVKHYMTEVWDTNGPMPIQQLNREVLLATTNDFQTYLRREMAPSVNLQEYPDPRNSISPQLLQQQKQLRQQQAALPYQPRAGPTFEPGMLLDTGTRFEQLQQDRQSGGSSRPVVPDFQIMMEDDKNAPAALTLFENAKKLRDEEASRIKPIGSGSTEDSNPLVRYITPTTLNDANANPTLAMPIVSVPRGPLSQDILIKQDDILTYKETEHNLFVYSADRNWLANVKENRYNFTVNFDTGNNQQGYNYSPSSAKKFKNIVRIELVKAILPTEGLTNIVQKTGASFNTLPKVTILGYPYIMVHIPELDNNNFGTDNYLDNAFGVLQYDANWYPDTDNLTDGFLAMIPKFLKCQKVYQPTPLATLTKLSIQLQLPSGSIINTSDDTLTIQTIYFGDSASTSVYATVDYIFIQTTTYFSQWAFTEGNNIQIQGLVASQISNTPAATDITSWLMNTTGYTIVGVGNTLSTSAPFAVTDGPNAVGYCNVLVLRNRFVDPTTGSTGLSFFGGQTSNTTLKASLVATTFTGAKLINLTHQTHLVFRIITREMDPTARLRPDNL
jgi:hypothetical protein